MCYNLAMDSIDKLLTRGVDTIYPSKKELETALRNGKKLRLYQGFDPTGAKLHIGHMVGLTKLSQWQELGHHVIFLIGDGTGQAGDPSGKSTARDKFMTRDELRQNAKDYVMQASKIVRFSGENPVEILFNGDWLNKLQLIDILDIAGHFSLQQLSERDMFQERIKRGESVNLREFLYPLLQGYDSVAMQIDLEIGGTDQTFNMLCGRTLVKAILEKEKYIMTTPLLVDSMGKKIGKTEGNAIAITDEPEELYGKIMGFPDEVIIKAIEYLTDISMEKINEIKKLIDEGENPMKYKKLLAFEVTSKLNSIQDAKNAELTFEKIVQKKEKPTDIPLHTIHSDSLLNALVETGLVLSKSDGRRVIEQGGVLVNDKLIDNSSALLSDFSDNKQATIQVGKHRFIIVKW
ncbi:MAG: tyrosine--tRNA ligase [Candidatus Levybacteria bacterium]|nr:tyrosine--tRNA ligase [Candidatus Levybacteria bacterium]